MVMEIVPQHLRYAKKIFIKKIIRDNQKKWHSSYLEWIKSEHLDSDVNKIKQHHKTHHTKP